MTDIGDTIHASSDQINATDLVGGPITVTIGGVDVDTKKQQPVDIHLVEIPNRVYRPNKGMRKGLIACWGNKSAEYAGRRLTLYYDPDTMWKGKKVGGIKISHASHISEPVEFSLLVARNPVPHEIKPLPDAPPQYAEPSPIPVFESLDEARDYYTHRSKAGASPDELQAIIAAAPPADTTPTNKENN